MEADRRLRQESRPLREVRQLDHHCLEIFRVYHNLDALLLRPVCGGIMSTETMLKISEQLETLLQILVAQIEQVNRLEDRLSKLEEHKEAAQDALDVALFIFKDTNWAKAHGHLASK